jgi:outer membrane murein-binding lipoprotein Lpp
MTKTMTPEQKLKLRQAAGDAAAERKDRADNALTFGKCKVYKLDEYNTVIAETGKEYSYYPTLAAALQGLLHKKIDEHTAKNVRELSEQIDSLEAEIFARFTEPAT